MEALRELRYAARALAASPVFAFAATATLALGVGATTAVFSRVHGVLLTPLPFRDASRLAVVQEIVPEIAERYPLLGANPRSFGAWTNGCRSTCESLAVLAGATGTLTSGGEPEGLVGVVFPEFLRRARAAAPGQVVVHGSRGPARRGRRRRPQPRTLDETLRGRLKCCRPDCRARWSAHAGDWRARIRRASAPWRFGLRCGRRRASLSSSGPSPGARTCFAQRASTTTPRLYDMAGAATPAQVAAELDALTETEFRTATIHPRTRVLPMGDQMLGPWRRPLLLLLASVLAALAIACVNVANLLGGRWVAGRRELAIRSAMGANAGALLRLVASESALLAATGRTAGLLVAWGGLRTLIDFAPAGIPRLESVRLDAAGFGFALVTVLCCGIVCSLLPARHVLRGGTGDTLKSAAHTQQQEDRRPWRFEAGSSASRLRLDVGVARARRAARLEPAQSAQRRSGV